MSHGDTLAPALGLRANWRQFGLLVLVNAFVGGMVGLERTVVPLIAEQEFGLVSRTMILSFIVSFGLVKAVTNLAAGRLSDRIGRKPLLVAGWLVGLPVPLLIIWAPRWEWIVAANVFQGVAHRLLVSVAAVRAVDMAVVVIMVIVIVVAVRTMDMGLLSHRCRSGIKSPGIISPLWSTRTSLPMNNPVFSSPSSR